MPQVHGLATLENHDEPLPAKPTTIETTIRRLCATTEQTLGQEPQIWLPHD